HLLLIPLSFLLANKRFSQRALYTLLTLFLGACLLCSLFCLGSALHSYFDASGSVAAPLQYLTFRQLTEWVGITPVYLSMFFNLALLITMENPFLGPTAKKFVAGYLVLFILLIGS